MLWYELQYLMLLGILTPFVGKNLPFSVLCRTFLLFILNIQSTLELISLALGAGPKHM